MNEILKKCKYNAIRLRELCKWLAVKKKRSISAYLFGNMCELLLDYIQINR